MARFSSTTTTRHSPHQIAPIIPAARLAQPLLCAWISSTYVNRNVCVHTNIMVLGASYTCYVCSRVSMKMPIHHHQRHHHCVHFAPRHRFAIASAKSAPTLPVPSAALLLRASCSRTSPAVDFIRYFASSLCDFHGYIKCVCVCVCMYVERI